MPVADIQESSFLKELRDAAGCDERPVSPARSNTRKKATVQFLSQARAKLSTATIAASQGNYTQAHDEIAAAICDASDALDCCKVKRQFEGER